MDFRTKKLNREKIRKIARIIKKEIFKSKDIYYFDVIYALEKLPILYDNVRVEIIDDEDSEIFSGAPSSIRIEDDGTYVIYIKQKVYEKAADNENGGYRMHIMHEICHYFLFSMGYTPIFDRTYKNKDLKPFESIERQAKALAGEILIPYDDTINLTVEEIMSKCKVSKDAAMYRIKLDMEVLNDK